MERLPRPVMMRMSVSAARTASSTTYWMAGLSTTGSISFGCDFVAGRNLVPRPAAGITAFLTFIAPLEPSRQGVYPSPRWRRSGRIPPRFNPGAARSLRKGGPDRPYNRTMPTYEYVCLSCGTHVEVFQRFSEESLRVCGVCGGELRKVFHPAGILFKGSGFYATDSRSGKGGGRSTEPQKETAAARSDGSGGEQGKGRSKATESAASGSGSEKSASGSGSDKSASGSEKSGSGGPSPGRHRPKEKSA